MAALARGTLHTSDEICNALDQGFCQFKFLALHVRLFCPPTAAGTDASLLAACLAAAGLCFAHKRGSGVGSWAGATTVYHK